MLHILLFNEMVLILCFLWLFRKGSLISRHQHETPVRTVFNAQYDPVVNGTVGVAASSMEKDSENKTQPIVDDVYNHLHEKAENDTNPYAGMTMNGEYGHLGQHASRSEQSHDDEYTHATFAHAGEENHTYDDSTIHTKASRTGVDDENYAHAGMPGDPSSVNEGNDTYNTTKPFKSQGDWRLCTRWQYYIDITLLDIDVASEIGLW